MAKSGSFTTSGWSSSSAPDYYKFSWKLSSQSVSGNYSVISWSLVAGGGSDASSWVNVKEKYVKVNGAEQKNSTVQKTYNGTTPFSGTTTIYHNSDGTKSFSASAGGAFYNYGSYNSTGSGTWSLPTIARASTIKSITSSVEVGKPVTVNINRNDSSFTHHVRFYINDEYSSDTFEDVGTSKSWEIPTSWYNSMPSSTSITAHCNVATYDKNGKYVASYVTSDFKVTVPQGIVPTIEDSQVILNPHNINNHDILVQGKNKLEVKVNQCSAGIGSTIKSYTISGQDFSTTKKSTATSMSVSGGPISKDGELTYTITVTDKRDRSSYVKKTITSYKYEQPSITSFNAYRAKDTNGTPDQNGTYLYCTYDTKYSSVNGTNSISATVYYKTGQDIEEATGSNGVVCVDLGESNNTYDVYLEIKDSYDGKCTSQSITVFGSFRILNITKDGTGVAIGKKAESSNLFDVKWPSYFNDGVSIKNDLAVNGELTIGGNRLYKPTLFFSGTNNGTITITLDEEDTLDNYTYLEIFYTYEYNVGHNYTKVYVSQIKDGITVDLSIVQASSTTGRTYIRRTAYVVTCTDNVVTLKPSTEKSSGYVQIDNSTVKTETGTNYINIRRVVGYK